MDVLGCDNIARIEPRGVDFKTDPADLTDQSPGILDGAAETLSACPDDVMEEAHTDSGMESV